MSNEKISVAKHRLGFAIRLPNVWAADVLVSDDEARDLTNALLAAALESATPMPGAAPNEVTFRRMAMHYLGEQGVFSPKREAPLTELLAGVYESGRRAERAAPSSRKEHGGFDE